MKSIKAPVIAGVNGAALPMFILTGAKDRSLSNQTKDIEKLLKRSRGSDLAKKSLSVELGDTSVQGADFGRGKRGREMMLQFINLKVISESDRLGWQDRSK